jgi:hypothetical protein
VLLFVSNRIINMLYFRLLLLYLLICLYLISCGMFFVDEVVVSVCCLLRGDYFNFVFSFSVTKEGSAEYEVCVS